MEKDAIFFIVEMIVFSFSFFSILTNITRVSVNVNHVFFGVITGFILLVCYFFTKNDYLIGLSKVILFLSFIQFGYAYKNNSVLVLIGILLFNSVMSYLSNWQLDKYSVIPITFISLLLATIYWRHNNVRYILIFIVLLDVLQGIYTEYRGQLLYCSVVLFFLTFNISIRKHISSIFLATSVGYIILLYFIGYLYFVSHELVLSPTASNIERTSMIYWSVNSISDFLFQAPTVSFFEENAGMYKSQYLMGHDIPSDPHSFILMVYIYLGFVPAILFIFVIYFMIKRVENMWVCSKENDYIALALFQAIILFSMHPFNSFSRLFVGITLGLFIAFGKQQKKQVN